jgi:hypothetical protein
MKTNKLKTTINNKFIFKQKNLSYHTKCILSKIITDILCAREIPNFEYVEENIFGVWPEEIVWDAINELADTGIMFINFIGEDEIDEDNEFEDEEIIFDIDFLKKVYISFDHCSCCDPAPTNFNVIYN